MMNRVVMYLILILLATLFVKGVVEPTADYHEMTGGSIIEMIENDNKRNFEEMNDDAKKEAINKGYFYSCKEVANYCDRNTVLGCKKYCDY